MKKTILAMLAASVCVAAMATPVKGDKAQLHFLETTDVHGSFFPIDFISGMAWCCSTMATFCKAAR